MSISPRLTISAYAEGIARADHLVLARAITLVESTLEADHLLAENLLNHLQASQKQSLVVGITGPPGVGKSTLIEALGLHLVGQGKRIAVLAIDPSSVATGGSILGDKTRMDLLARHPLAFIRPAASRGHLGGAALGNREAIALCEAAGFDIVLLETVGVGQSEIEVRNMVDIVLLAQNPATGDDLQGIKKGIMEIADIISINKADGQLLEAANQTAEHLRQALHYAALPASGWAVPVCLCSGATGSGIHELADIIYKCANVLLAEGVLANRRSQSRLAWFREEIGSLFFNSMANQPKWAKTWQQAQESVAASKVWPRSQARAFLAQLLG